MKKPEITEGKWFITEYNKAPKHSVCDIGGEYTIGADPGNNVDESALADAKVISQVPNLLKIGLKIYNRCKGSLGKNVFLDEFEEEVKELGEVLKKAGCE